MLPIDFEFCTDPHEPGLDRTGWKLFCVAVRDKIFWLQNEQERQSFIDFMKARER